MNIQLGQLKSAWQGEDISATKANSGELLQFRSHYQMALPQDLSQFFIHLNGTGGEYDAKFFKFNSLTEFLPVTDVFKDWEGPPEHQKIFSLLPNCENCFVAADYHINLFVYLIRLSKKEVASNEVYIICGDKYQLIANSFSEFITLYLEDSPKLMFE